EYFHAYNDLNLKLTSGVYGSNFYMLTGFHAFHVFAGMLMLLFITLRLGAAPHRRQRRTGTPVGSIQPSW
ncbi:MAG: cytochrome c oxidase subunit 3, partial [Rhizobacter sp.]